MKTGNLNRRTFLEAITATAAGGAFLIANSPITAANARQEYDGDYLFADGLTYLNTGTLGPCRRETIQESLKMWEELESMPVKYYGKFGAEALAEKTRTIAAGVFDCELQGIPISKNNTRRKNAVSQGLRFKT